MRAEKGKIIQKGYDDSLALIREAKEGRLELAAGMDVEGTLEAKVSGVLSKVRDSCAEICMKELSRHNAPLIMAVCGSKGGSMPSHGELECEDNERAGLVLD